MRGADTRPGPGSPVAAHAARMSARRRTAFAVTWRPAPTKAATARARVSSGHSRAASTPVGVGLTAVLCPWSESGPGRRDHQTSPIGVDVGCVAPRGQTLPTARQHPERLASLPRSAGAALEVARTCSYVSAAFVAPLREVARGQPIVVVRSQPSGEVGLRCVVGRWGGGDLSPPADDRPGGPRGLTGWAGAAHRTAATVPGGPAASYLRVGRTAAVWGLPRRCRAVTVPAVRSPAAMPWAPGP